MKKLQIMFISILCSMQVVAAEKNVEGEYNLKGGSLYVLPNQQFAVVGYATALAGNYEVKGDTLQLHWASEKYPKIVINQFHDLSEEYNQDINKPKADQMLIQFDSELPSSLYIGVNQTSNQPHLKKIFNDDVNCVEYSKMNKIFSLKSNNNIILYQINSTGKSGFSQQYQIPKNINRIEIRLNKNELARRMRQAKIKNNSLIFENGVVAERSALSEMSKEDSIMVQQIIQQNNQVLSFESQSVKLSNIQFDHRPIINMKCE